MADESDESDEFVAYPGTPRSYPVSHSVDSLQIALEQARNALMEGMTDGLECILLQGEVAQLQDEWREASRLAGQALRWFEAPVSLPGTVNDMEGYLDLSQCDGILTALGIDPFHHETLRKKLAWLLEGRGPPTEQAMLVQALLGIARSAYHLDRPVWAARQAAEAALDIAKGAGYEAAIVEALDFVRLLDEQSQVSEAAFAIDTSNR